MLTINLIKPHIQRFLCWILSMQNYLIINYNKPTGHDSVLVFIQINWKICERMSTEYFVFLYNCDPEWSSRSFKITSECTDLSHLSSNQTERNQSVNIWTKSNITSFFASPKNHLCRILSLEYWSNEIFKISIRFTCQVVWKACWMPSKSTDNFAR